MMALLISAAVMLHSADPVQQTPLARANAEVIARYYPRESIRRGEEGLVGFHIKLDNKGRLSSCEITRSSGYNRLDEVTCDVIVNTAYFQKVRDANGLGRTSTHDGELLWSLTGRSSKEPPPRTSKITAETIICRRQPLRGSLIITEKVCLSKSDWYRQESYAKAAVFAMQSPQGSPY